MLRYFWPGKPVSFFCTVTVVVLVFAFLGHYSKAEFTSCQIEFALETEQPVNFALYYDVGRGFNEVDHQSVMIDAVDEPATVNFCIPILNRLESIRVDPSREHAKMKISSVTLVYDDGESFDVPLDSIEPLNDILEQRVEEGKLVFETTPDGEDPMLLLTKIRSTEPGSRSEDPSHYILWMLAGLLSVLLGGFVWQYFIAAR